MALYNANSTSIYREFPTQTYFGFPSAMTAAIWVKPKATNPTLGSFFSRGTGGNNSDWNLSNVNATQHFRASLTTSGAQYTAADPGSWVVGGGRDGWYHVCQRWTGTSLDLLIDGFVVATTATTGTVVTNSTDAIRVFERNNSTTNFDGPLARMGLWRVALTLGEVQALAAGVDPRRVAFDNLLLSDDLRLTSLDGSRGLVVLNVGALTEHPEPPFQSERTAHSRPWPHLQRKRYDIAATSSPDVTVAATGVSGTGAAGTVAPSTTVPVTGNAGTSALGTVAPATTVPVTGNGATGGVGSVTETHPGTVAATGASATGAVGTVAPGTVVTPTGVAGTGAAGTVTPDTALAVTGVTGTGSPGTVAPSTTVGATGVAGTGAVGSVGASQAGSVSVTGVAGTGAAGTAAPSTSVAASGVAAAGSPGTVAPATALAITGAAAAGAAGTVAPNLTVGITGNSATGAVGTVSASAGGAVTVAATGVSATGAVGSVTVSGGDVAASTTRGTLTGVLQQFDVNLALVSAASSTGGTLHPGCRFTLEREPVSQMDGDYFLDVEAVTPVLRNRAIGEAYWEAAIVVRIAYHRGGGDLAGGDRQSVMRDGLDDAMRLADVCENPANYASSTTTNLSEVKFQGAIRAATFKRGEIWETRFLARWRADSFTA